MHTVMLPAHVLTGMLALVFGYVALYATKGLAVHRKSGVFFVYAMTVMSLSGAVMDALKTGRVSVNVVAGLVTFYCVTTGLLAVRARVPASPLLDRAGLVLALAVSLLAFAAGVDLVGRGRPEAAPSFIFSLVALLAAVGDVRMLRAGGYEGVPRLKRHLWRMCFAMWVAAASFFWGPPTRVPEVIRIPALQATAVLLPVGVMLYWVWRLRAKRAARAIVHLTAPEAI